MYAAKLIQGRYRLYTALFALVATLALMVAPVSAHSVSTASGTGNRTVIHGHQVPATHGKPT